MPGSLSAGKVIFDSQAVAGPRICSLVGLHSVVFSPVRSEKLLESRFLVKNVNSGATLSKVPRKLKFSTVPHIVHRNQQNLQASQKCNFVHTLRQRI